MTSPPHGTSAAHQAQIPQSSSSGRPQDGQRTASSAPHVGHATHSSSTIAPHVAHSECVASSSSMAIWSSTDVAADTVSVGRTMR